jgi:hypothetical protein
MQELLAQKIGLTSPEAQVDLGDVKVDNLPINSNEIGA